MSTPPAPTPPRKRGAPRGNHNAIKHGFYSRYFRTSELVDLSAVDAAGLQSEITALRIFIRRLVECYTGPSGQPSAIDTNPHEAASALDTLGLATIRLASLLKTQQLLDRHDPAATLALSQALTAISKELGLQALSDQVETVVN
jgi:hypothetical protein